MPITTILFDLGKTFLNFSFDPINTRLMETSGKSMDEIKSLIKPKYKLYGRGEMDGHDWHEFITTTFGLDMPYDEFRVFWGDIFVPIEGMFDLAHRTHKNHRQYLLSNTDDIHLPFCLERFPEYFDGLLDGMILSYEAEANKPDPEIYQYGIDRFDLVPDECVFIDDLQENLDGGAALGIHGVLVQTPEQVEADLSKLGVQTR